MADFSDEQMRTNLKDIITILRTFSEEDALEFLILLLTKKETKDIAKRLAIVKYLDESMAQRTIAQILGVSLCKITRGSSELKKPHSVLKKGMNILKGFKTEI